MTKTINNLIAPVIILSCIFAVLFYARMIPAINNKVEFILDSSFNYRMTDELIRSGAVPSIDKLSTYPQGKDINALLPTGMYYACAVFHKAVNLFRETPLSVSILLFSSFFGSLIIIPSYLISFEIYRNRPAAYIAAFLAGIIPAYLNRTICYWYRYEMPAVPILFMSLYFFIKAFNAREDKKTFIYMFISVAFLIASLFIWRLAIIFCIAYILCVIYMWMRSGKVFKKAIIALFALFCLYIMLLLFIPGFGLRNPGSNYGAFPKAVAEIYMQKMGVPQHFSEFTRLVVDNQELAGTPILNMFDWKNLSLSGLFILLFASFYFASRERSPQKDMLFIFLTFFFILTFLVSRNKIMLGPLVAIASGESINYVMNRNKGRSFKVMVLILALIIVKTGFDAHKLAVTRHSNTKLSPYLAQVIRVINKSAPANAVFSCYWADGYPIQAYCGKPTLTDGLFESPDIVKRILDESRAYYSFNEDELWNYCKSHGATHLLVPMQRTLSYAHQGGVEYGRFFLNTGSTATGRLTVLYKLMYAPKGSSRFRELFRNKGYAIYQVR